MYRALQRTLGLRQRAGLLEREADIDETVPLRRVGALLRDRVEEPRAVLRATGGRERERVVDPLERVQGTARVFGRSAGGGLSGGTG